MRYITLLTTLAVGILFAGPAFAEKFKATLDGKSETPPNTSARASVGIGR